MHLFQEVLALVELELGLRKVAVELILPLLHPLLGDGALAEELMRVGDVPEVGLQAEGELQEPGPLGLHCRHVSLDDGRGRMAGDDKGLTAILDGAEAGLATLELRHELLVIAFDVLEVEVAVAPVAVVLGVLLVGEPRQLGVGGGDEVVQGVQVGHALVRQHEELVVGLLEDGHALAVDLELLAVEADLGLATLLDVALELVDHLVLLLVAVVLGLDGLHVGTIIRLSDLFLETRKQITILNLSKGLVDIKRKERE